MDRPAIPAPFGTHRPSAAAGALIAAARHTPLGRGKARKAVMAAVSALQAEPYDVSLWGLPVRLYPGANVCERKVLLSPARYDAQELAFLSKALDRPDALFVDIGANSGIYSFYMAAHARAPLTIHCFEPQPELVRRIEEKFALAATALPQVNINIHPHALGESEGSAVLSFGQGDLGGGSLVAHANEQESDHNAGAQAQAGLTVRIAGIRDTIDKLGISRIDALKIDIEGYEDHVLRPLFETCPKSLLPRALLLEHVSKDQWSYDCLSAAESLGYRPQFRTRNNTALVLPD